MSKLVHWHSNAAAMYELDAESSLASASGSMHTVWLLLMQCLIHAQYGCGTEASTAGVAA